MRISYSVDQFARIKAVKAGASLLDRRYPLWWRRIDPTFLDMSQPDTCVIGQIGKDADLLYYEVVDDLGICKEGARTGTEACVCHEYGFTLVQDEADSEIADVFWHELRSLWLVEIFQRLEEDNEQE